MVIDVDETSKATGLKANSTIDMFFSRIIKVISKTMPTIAGMITASKGVCVAQANHHITTTTNAMELSKDNVGVVGNSTNECYHSTN